MNRKRGASLTDQVRRIQDGVLICMMVSPFACRGPGLAFKTALCGLLHRSFLLRSQILNDEQTGTTGWEISMNFNLIPSKFHFSARYWCLFCIVGGILLAGYNPVSGAEAPDITSLSLILCMQDSPTWSP